MKKMCWSVAVVVCTAQLSCMDRGAQPNSPDAAGLLKRSKSISEDLERLELRSQELISLSPSPAAPIFDATKAPNAFVLKPLIMPERPSAAAELVNSSPRTSPSSAACSIIVAHRKSANGKERRFFVILPPLQPSLPVIDTQDFTQIGCSDEPKSKKMRR